MRHSHRFRGCSQASTASIGWTASILALKTQADYCQIGQLAQGDAEHTSAVFQGRNPARSVPQNSGISSRPAPSRTC